MSDQVSSESSWPSWKIALAVGIPAVVVGVGGYCYYSRSRTSKSEKDPTSSKSKTERFEPEGSSYPQKTLVQVPKEQSKPKESEPPKTVVSFI